MHRIIIRSYNPSLLPPDIPTHTYRIIHKLRLYPEYHTTKLVDGQQVSYKYIEYPDMTLNIDYVALYRQDPRRLPMLLRAAPDTIKFLSQVQLPYNLLSPSVIEVDVSSIPFSAKEKIKYRLNQSKLNAIVIKDADVL